MNVLRQRPVMYEANTDAVTASSISLIGRVSALTTQFSTPLTN